MTTPQRTPEPERPIAIAPYEGTVTVRFDGVTVADSDRALALREADYPIVYYVPREDVDLDSLQPTEHRTVCPFKGEASHYTVLGDGERAENAAWSYENPLPDVAAIGRHLAFYPDKVEIVAEPGRGEAPVNREARG